MPDKDKKWIEALEAIAGEILNLTRGLRVETKKTEKKSPHLVLVSSIREGEEEEESG